MNKKILAVDLDATLADVQQVFIRLAKERHGVDVKFEEIDGWNFWAGKIGADNMWRIFRDIWVDHWQEVPEQEDDVASALYKALGMGWEITIITSTQKDCIPQACLWLERHKIPYKSIVGLFNAQSKFDYPWSAIIDDNPKMAELALQHPDRRIFLRDQPWNRHVPPGGYFRIRTFDEALQELA